MSSNTPKSIVAVTCNLFLGGATTFLLNFLRVLKRRSDSMLVLSFSDVNEHESDFAEIGANAITADLSGLIYEDRLAWAFEQVAKSRPDAVLACLGAESFEILRLVPPGVARIGIIQSHDPLPYAMAQQYGPWVDAMIGVSSEICSHLRAIPAFSNKRIVHIPYGIDFSPPLSRLPSSPSRPLRVLYLGRLIEEQKRVSRLAEVINRLSDSVSNVSFTIAGSGPDQASFLSSIEHARNVRYVGQVPNANVAQLLQEHDVYILLSDYEGLPLSLLEAMGSGLVPVVSDIPGGLQEVVTSDVGVRIPVGSIDRAASSLTELASNRNVLDRLSVAAAIKVRENYSAENMVAGYLELIESLVGAVDSRAWTHRPRIPAPAGLNRFIYAGPARALRRFLKTSLRLTAWRPTPSSQV